ncbi:MAG TPA: type II secretion system F family protein [Pirellulaceae bacterium]|nr:type II secretion system F family protein [Pirellulaceae bacterium]
MFLLAATEVNADSMPLLASLLMGLGAAALWYWLATTLDLDDLEQGDQWRYDITRINELRRIDPLFRFLQPVIQQFARFNRVMFRGSLPEIQRQLQAAGLPRFWLPEEYLGRCQLLALLLTPGLVWGCIQLMGVSGVVFGLLLGVLVAYLLRRRLASLARNRLNAIKVRLPYLLDLLTLLMEAGSTFMKALEEGVDEFRGHPIASEFNRVLQDVDLGKTRNEAFYALRDRLHDDDITGIIGAIVQGEELGTPIAQVFRTQAEVLRMKRSQRAETVAGEAGVNMLLPGVLVMLSSVLVILGPFLLNFLAFGFTP